MGARYLAQLGEVGFMDDLKIFFISFIFNQYIFFMFSTLSRGSITTWSQQQKYMINFIVTIINLGYHIFY
jgi:hypothetical protein